MKKRYLKLRILLLIFSTIVTVNCEALPRKNYDEVSLMPIWKPLVTVQRSSLVGIGPDVGLVIGNETITGSASLALKLAVEATADTSINMQIINPNDIVVDKLTAVACFRAAESFNSDGFFFISKKETIENGLRTVTVSGRPLIYKIYNQD